MTEVLTPVLGEGLARERANNIAQVLVFVRLDPTQVAKGMLRSVVERDLERVALEVGLAWERGMTMEKAV